MNKNNWIGTPYSDLTPTQKGFLTSVIQDSDRSYLLKGCAGSGKTIIAAHAVRMLRENNKKTKLLVYTKLLSKFINDGFKSIGKDIVDVEHFHSWRPDFKENIDMIVVDESQDFQRDWISKVKSFSKNQIWLGDASQQIYSDPKEEDGFGVIDDELSDSNTTVLNTNHRNSISIAQLAKHFIRLNKLDKKYGLTLEEKINNFIIPITKNELQISNARNQPNLFIEAVNESEEFDSIVKIVKDIQRSDEANKKIAIVHLRHASLDIIERELNRRDLNFVRIPHYQDRVVSELPDFNMDNLTVLSPIHSLKGLEFDYIIFPRTEGCKIGFWEDEEINDNLMFVLFTRAKNRIICSYVNRESSYIYQSIKNDCDNDFYQFVSASEIIGNGVPKESKEDVEKMMEKYFKGLGLS